MNPWPILLSTGCFHSRGIFGVLGALHDAGFAELEICSSPSHLNYRDHDDVRRAGELMRRSGLQPFSFHAPFADWIDITALDDTHREAGVQAVLCAVEAAALIGATHLVLHPGPEREGRPPDGEFLQHMHHAAVSLNRVAARCCELGVHLLLENMLPHLMFGHVRDIMYLLGEITSCDVGTCLDTGHAHLSGEMGWVIDKLSGHLKMVHVNDNSGDWDAHLPPGDGAIDWAWVLHKLREDDFRGKLVLELAGGEHESTQEILARAMRARSYLEQLMQQPG